MRALLLAFLAFLAFAACGKSESKSGLAMQSSSAACKKAMACCEQYVKIKKGGSKIEDVNELCSGAAMATTDADCDQFRKGYVAALEEGSKTVPAECK